jgi:hypothetical protein
MSFRRFLSKWPSRPPKKPTPEQKATDEALARLKRAELPTLPEFHIHLDSVDTPEKESLPKWVKITLALGLPAMVLEIVRRLLEVIG